jgi:GAF domain-containing protein
MADGPLAAAAVPDEQQSLEAALRREQRKLALVQDVSRALSSVGDLDQLLALIMEKVTELMDADRATLFLVDEADGTLSSKVVQGGDLVEIRLASGEGVAGWVAQTRELVNIPDAYADQRFQPAFDLRSGYRTTTILSVPMTGANGALVGVLQVLNKKSDGAFSRADEELLGALAGPAAIAIENARLYQSLLLQNLELSDARRDLERRQRELNALYEVEKDMSHALDLDDLLSRILAQAIGVLGAGAGSIALVEPDGSLRFRTVQGPAAPRLIERTLPHGTGLIGWSIAHKTPVIVDNPGDDPRHALEVARESGVTPAHLMVAPLVDGEDVMGGIEIIDQRRQVRDSRSQIRGPWNEVDLRLLVLIAAQAASAIGLARRRSEQSKSDRLASIGRMLAGLLHDLKTPMTIISGYGQLMAASDDSAQREQYVEQIQRQFDLMAGMTREVLAFARGAIPISSCARSTSTSSARSSRRSSARRPPAAASTSASRRASTASRSSTSRSCSACFTTSRATRSRRCPRAASCASRSTSRAISSYARSSTAARASPPSCAVACSNCSRPRRKAAPASASRS